MRVFIIPFVVDSLGGDRVRSRVAHDGKSLIEHKYSPGDLFASLNRIDHTSSFEFSDVVIDGEMFLIASTFLPADIANGYASGISGLCEISSKTLPPHFSKLDHQIWESVRSITVEDVEADILGVLKRIRYHEHITEDAISLIGRKLLGIDAKEASSYRIPYETNVGYDDHPIHAVAFFIMVDQILIGDEQVNLAIAVSDDARCWVTPASACDNDIFVKHYPQFKDPIPADDIAAVVRLLS